MNHNPAVSPKGLSANQRGQGCLPMTKEKAKEGEEEDDNETPK